jgi:hypothetical protein
VVAAIEKVAANAKNAQKSKKNMRLCMKIVLAATLFFAVTTLNILIL